MTAPAFVPEVLERMLYWIRERESIRRRKEAGEPWPWTSDRLLQEWRWCNVRRMDDKVSRELMASWYRADADVSTQMTAAVLARTVNWTAALLDASSGRPFTLDLLPQVRERLHDRAERGEKVFTGAYIVPGQAGRSKVDTICDLTEKVAARAGSLCAHTLRETWANLLELDGLGSFLAGQVVADLAHLPLGKAWPDRFTWAPVGPGSARGLNRLLGRPLKRAVPQAEFDQLLPHVMEAFASDAPEIWIARGLSFQDAQNCQGDKHERLLAKEGTVRARYAPPRAQQGLLLGAGSTPNLW
jgi:hypothetical protein